MNKSTSTSFDVLAPSTSPDPLDLPRPPRLPRTPSNSPDPQTGSFRQSSTPGGPSPGLGAVKKLPRAKSWSRGRGPDFQGPMLRQNHDVGGLGSFRNLHIRPARVFPSFSASGEGGAFSGSGATRNGSGAKKYRCAGARRKSALGCSLWSQADVQVVY